jgi:hypothetical protein
LLEHDFRNPDAVRILRASPRQIALKLAKPSKQLPAQGFELTVLEHVGQDSRTKGGDTRAAALLQPAFGYPVRQRTANPDNEHDLCWTALLVL